MVLINVAVVEFVVENQVEHCGWLYLGCQMDYYQCSRNFLPVF